MPVQSQNNAPPALPLHDIADRIFDFLDDTRGLLACALTSRTLRGPSQKRLFRVFDIRLALSIVPGVMPALSGNPNSTFESFIDTIVNAPHLHTYPRSLSIVGIQNSDGPGVAPYAIDVVFLQLLPCLSQLHTLKIRSRFAFTRDFIYWTSVGAIALPVHTALKSLSLESNTIDAISNNRSGQTVNAVPSPSVPLVLFDQFPHLSKLQLVGVLFAGQSVSAAIVDSSMLEDGNFSVQEEWAVARGLTAPINVLFSPLLYMSSPRGRELRALAKYNWLLVAHNAMPPQALHNRFIKLESLKLRLNERAFLFFVSWLLLSPICPYSIGEIGELEVAFGSTAWYHSRDVHASPLLRRLLLATRSVLLNAKSTLETFSFQVRGLYLGDCWVYRVLEDVFPQMTRLTVVNLQAEVFGDSLQFEPEELFAPDEYERDVEVYFRLLGHALRAPNLRRLQSFLDSAEADAVEPMCQDGSVSPREQAETLAEEAMDLEVLKEVLRDSLRPQTGVDFRAVFCGGYEIMSREQAGLVEDVIREAFAEVGDNEVCVAVT